MTTFVELDAAWRAFVNHSLRQPTLLLLPESQIPDYERALYWLQQAGRSTEPSRQIDLRNSIHYYRDALVVPSRWVKQPTFAWTHDRIETE